MAERSFTTLRSNVAELDEASRDRFEDAKVLIAAGRSASAISAGLHALEIRLKVLICKKLDLVEMPRAFEIHDLKALLILTGLSRRLDDPANVDVRINWEEILQAGEELNDLRYMPDRKWSASQAISLLNRLEDPTTGILTWLNKQA